jgi:hypothetical protein
MFKEAWNIDIQPQHYTASQPRRYEFESSVSFMHDMSGSNYLYVI